MKRRLKAVTFDVDPETLVSVNEALPNWEILATQGATTASIEKDWDPGDTDLLIVGARYRIADTLGLCRLLRSQLGRARTPLVVLAPRAHKEVLNTALEAGATACLLLPLQVRDLLGALSSLRESNRPGRSVAGRARTQPARTQPGDQSRDDGGES